MLDGERLLFLGGLHRSGTTLLAQLLAAHDEASGFQDTGVPADEGQHLQTVYPPALAFGGPGKFAFHADARMIEAPDAADHRAALSEQWSPYWDLSKRCLVEKSPPNMIRMRYLQSVFSGSRFVLVLRHPLVVAMATLKWSRTSHADLLRHWLTAYALSEEDALHVDHLRVITYEQLVSDPEHTLQGLFAWLGLPPLEVPVQRVHSSNESYLARWLQRQQDDVSLRTEAQQLEDEFETSVRRYGYSLRDLSAAPMDLSEVFPQ